MSRVLTRPMFRLGGSIGGTDRQKHLGMAEGGSTSGITTGLDRQGYSGGSSAYFDDDKLEAYAKRSQEVSDKFFPQQGPDINRFLINFGLDLASRSPQGGLLSTAAAAAKGPTGDLYESIDRSKLMRGKTGADIFSEIIAAEGEAASGESGARWQKQWALDKVKGAYKGIQDNTLKIEELKKDPNWETVHKEEIRQLQDQINNVYKVEIGQLQEDNPLISSLSANKEIINDIYKSTLKKLANVKEEIVVTEENKNLYPDNEIGESIFIKKYDKDSPEIIAEAIRQIQIMFGGTNIDLNFLRQSNAQGGRAGYQMGSLVEEEVTETVAPEAGPMGQEPSVEPVGMSYDELRSRLPETINDEIVILLSQSGQALEDFATIQTQQDVDNFNTKYNVNLILPSEG